MDGDRNAQAQAALAGCGVLLQEQELAAVLAVHRTATAPALRALALLDIEPETTFDPRWR